MLSQSDFQVLNFLLKNGKCAFYRKDSVPDYFTEVRVYHLKSLGFIQYEQRSNDTCYILTPEGEDAVSEYCDELRRRAAELADRRWTRALAIIAIIISMLALALEFDDRGYVELFKAPSTPSAPSLSQKSVQL